MSTKKEPQLAQHFRLSDIRGITQLVTEATDGVTHIVEEVHEAVLKSIPLPAKQKKHVTAFTNMVYAAIYYSINTIGKTADTALQLSIPGQQGKGDQEVASTCERETTLAVLNGVMGDRLTATNSPFSTNMTMWYNNQPNEWLHAIPDSKVSGKVLLMVHGLCMYEQQWQTKSRHNHANVLAGELGYTPVYLRYNSGLHISQNGQALASQLETLIAQWPVPIEQLTILTHSMGGLVARSAMHFAQAHQMSWLSVVKNIIFLGTPHQGAPMEKVGHWLDLLLGVSNYSAPFAKLGKLRSAGITDLRFGYVQEKDWLGYDRFAPRAVPHSIVPLPESPACYSIAATVSKENNQSYRSDKLVPVNSALGWHKDPSRRLHFDTDKQWISCETNHMELLSKPIITAQLLKWLCP